MIISLSPETQKLLDDYVKRGGFVSADDAIRCALETAGRLDDEELDDETLAQIEEGLAQAARGEGRPWEEVRAELLARYDSK